ncbi:DUF1801 domain-containing protein [Cellulomonas fengjieae]|uniref:DUF1801 domain-containing protein n=1 Tax=Cellulomonas fengjieae TaxID=2819978 RepID=A0ABS3SEQ1_9CELL|nr:DUF1801 domain-containing protein [Cellulomonas fengjieae]MBO3084217.1 DUF1801 domain-containing protein [Cellulomonas fengjieae]QVI64541.1 DUF1801 domain-containing protein [Cellulomonas fengjieae]
MAHEPNGTSDVDAFLAAVDHPVRRRDALALAALMARVTGEQPRMWGPSIVGFGTHHYVYPSGREGDTPATAFSPRKAATTIYLADGTEAHAELLGVLGPHTLGKGCLYVKDLETVDPGVLEQILRRSYAAVTEGTFGG